MSGSSEETGETDFETCLAVAAGAVGLETGGLGAVYAVQLDAWGREQDAAGGEFAGAGMFVVDVQADAVVAVDHSDAGNAASIGDRALGRLVPGW